MAGRATRVSAVPAQGDVIVGRDRAGRVLRVSGHPESDRVVLSIWQGHECLATFRLAGADVPALLDTVLQASSRLPGAGLEAG
jgi:hypothetical protein